MSRFLAVAATNGWNADLFAETYVEQVRPCLRATQPYALGLNFNTAYADRLWPRSRHIGSDPANSTAMPLINRVEFWQDVRPLGAGGWARITGVTRDSTGAVLGGCAVHVFRTSDDLERDMVTSDAGDGTYSVGVDTDAAHYCVAYRPNAPDVAGTTVNTLTGT